MSTRGENPGAAAALPAEQRPSAGEDRDAKGRLVQGNSYARAPGRSGNPRGRLPCKRLVTYLRQMLDRQVTNDAGETMSKMELLACAMIHEALVNGSEDARRAILDRIDPKLRGRANVEIQNTQVIYAPGDHHAPPPMPDGPRPRMPVENDTQDSEDQ